MNVSGGTEEQLAWLIAHQCRRLKLTPKELLERGELEVTSVRSPPPWLNEPVAIGMPAFRSIAKSGMAAVCKSMGRALIDVSDLDEAVRFIRFDERGPAAQSWTGGGGIALRQVAGTELGTHVLLVLEDATKSETWAIFAPFGAFAVAIRLAQARIGLTGSILHMVDPLSQNHRLEVRPGRFSLSDVLPGAERQTEGIASGVAELHQMIAEAQREDWLDAVMREAARPFQDLPPGTTPQEEHLRASREIVEGLMRMRATGESLEESHDPARVLERAQEILATLKE